MGDAPTVEQVLTIATESIAKARMSMTVVAKRWHRDNEDKAIRYAIQQLDMAGVALSSLEIAEPHKT